MKFDPRLTIQISNFPRDIERPELFAALTQIAKPKRFTLASGKAYLVFALESEKIDYMETFKTQPIVLFDQKLKVLDLMDVENRPKRVVIPVAYEQLKEQAVEKKMRVLFPGIKDPKVVRERGYFEKQVVEATFSSLVYSIPREAFEDSMKKIENDYPEARDYDGSSKKLMIAGLPHDSNVNSIVAAIRSAYRISIKLLALAAGQKCYLKFFADSDADKLLAKGTLVVDGATCQISVVEEQEEESYDESGYSDMEESSTEKSEAAEPSQDDQEAEEVKEEEVEAKESSNSNVDVEIYDPNRPLSEELEESHENEEDVSEGSHAQSDAEDNIEPMQVEESTEPIEKKASGVAHKRCPEIFISGLPLYLPGTLTEGNTVKQTLRHYLIEIFKSFGHIEKCVVNEKDGNLAGSAFIEFVDEDTPAKIFGFLELTQKYRQTDEKGIYIKNAPEVDLEAIYTYLRANKVRNLLFKEQFDFKTARFKINDLAFDVRQPLTKNALENIKSEEEKTSRNEGLLKYGAKISGSGLEADVPPQDLAKRDKLYSELKFRAENPNYRFSETRLILKNLPDKMDEKELLSALWRFFAAIVASPTEQNFAADRLHGLIEKHHITKEDLRAQQASNKALNFLFELLKITELRIPRKGRAAINFANSNGDPMGRLTEIAKTGYFGYELQQMCVLEFKYNINAKQFFDMTDNEPRIFGKYRRPIVSFATENISAERKKQGTLPNAENDAGEQQRKVRSTKWAQERLVQTERKHDEM